MTDETLQEDRSSDYGRLMKKVEQLVEAIDQSDDIGQTVHTVVDCVISEFRDELGIYGGRLYRREGDGYVLLATFGAAKEVESGTRVPASYHPFKVLLDRRMIYMEADDPNLDRALEQHLGVEKFTAIEVSDKKYVLAFDVAPGSRRDEVLYSLSILRYAINQKIRQEKLYDVFREARRIQASILPRRMPELGHFDIQGRSDPMESVGGDHYDFIPITDKAMGIAVADVSGHGLPAALQVRDIYMGLRMGLSRDFKIVRTVERLNAIIHESTLTSRFVSMVYGELEISGNFIYVNAGHPAPFRVRADGTAVPLTQGGAVLGPLATATYERGLVNLTPGDLIVLYTDGIVEATPDPEGDSSTEYGSGRLLEVVRDLRDRSAREIVDAIFDDVASYTGENPPEDDRTVVVVRCPA